MLKFSRTLKTRQAIFSTDSDGISFYAPKSWKELTQDQLVYVLNLLVSVGDRTAIKTYMFFRFCGIHVIGHDKRGWQCYVRKSWRKRKPLLIKAWQVESLARQFDFIDSFQDMGVRLDCIQGMKAVDVRLHGVRFIDYLNCEKYYQAYLMNKEDERFIERMALLLYRKKNGKTAEKIKLSKSEALGTFLWFSYVKDEFAKAFPHFFRKTDGEGSGEFDMMNSINAQIRALTDGDVTKEQQIYDTDCWRALTELNMKAWESKEMKKRLGKTKK
ncbi:MAG: hypothetical protein LUC88_00260 [Prevotella sp.]|nr:hypothetical protein [Prevotella sp.]